jgi:hypothetical protein
MAALLGGHKDDDCGTAFALTVVTCAVWCWVKLHKFTFGV